MEIAYALSWTIAANRLEIRYALSLSIISQVTHVECRAINLRTNRYGLFY